MPRQYAVPSNSGTPKSVDDSDAWILQYPIPSPNDVSEITIRIMLEEYGFMVLVFDYAKNLFTLSGVFRSESNAAHMSTIIIKGVDFQGPPAKKDDEILFFYKSRDRGRDTAFHLRVNKDDNAISCSLDFSCRLSIKTIEFGHKGPGFYAERLYMTAYEGSDAQDSADLYFKTLLQKRRNQSAQEAAAAASGIQGPQPGGVQPPNYKALQRAANQFWSDAVQLDLTATQEAAVKNKYQQTMSDWVTTRGDNLSPTAYDYLTYAHGVAWPKAIIESTDDPSFLKVRARFQGMMKAYNLGI